MGNYRSQYENYYKGVRGNTKIEHNSNSIDYLADHGSGKSKKNKMSAWNLLIFQCIGSLLILVVFILIKAIPGEQGERIVTASKNIISENQIDTGKLVNIGGLKEVAYDYVDKLRTLVGGDSFLEETVEKNYLIPLQGNVEKLEDNKINIYTNEEMSVKASFDGKVKEVKTNKGIAVLLIDHGEGIETYYNNVSNLQVNKGDEIKKGQVIGKTAKSLSNNKIGIEFGLRYMGNFKIPTDYMNFKEALN